MEPPLHLKLASLCLISQKKLESILGKCGEKKDLIIDPFLIKPFEKVCGASWLRQRGVDKIYKLDAKPMGTVNQNRLYLIPASFEQYKCVLDHISSVLSLNPVLPNQNCFHIIITPKVLNMFETLLESRGLYGIVSLYSFAWELMVLDEGVLSLELPYLYRNTFVCQDQSLLSSISMSLWSLSHVIGKPKVSLAVGKMSASVLDILQVYNDTFTRQVLSSAECSQELGALVLMDRNQDYPASLLTPATYSGLLNEIFTVRSGNLELDVKNTKFKKEKLDISLTAAEATEKPPTMCLDSSTDSLYGEIKYRHFSEVLGVLSLKAKSLKQSNYKDLDVKEMKQFVTTQLQQIAIEKKNLVNHVMACETIITEMKNIFEMLKSTENDMVNNTNRKNNFNYIDEHFGTDIQFYYSLRLLCLLSLTQGLSADEYNSLVTKYLHAFSHKYLHIFTNLTNSGLLIQPSASKLPIISKKLGNISDHLPKWQNTFNSNATKLKQIPSEEDKMSKTCPSYAYHGSYIPLIAVLCNTLLTSNTLLDVMTRLNPLTDLRIGGQLLDKLKTGMETLDEKLSSFNFQDMELEYGCKQAKSITSLLKSSPNLGECFPLKPKCVLVYVIGGVSYAEITACDIIQRTTGSKVIVASDCIVTGSDLISANM